MWERITKLINRYNISLFLKVVAAHILVFIIITLALFAISFLTRGCSDNQEVRSKPTNEAVRTLEIELRGDSIKIDNIIKEYEKEIRNANALDDSASVKLFIKLVQAE